MPLAVFVTAGSLVIVATGVMRKWIGYFGLADGIAWFAAPPRAPRSTPMGRSDFSTSSRWSGGTAWIVATGVSLARRREEPGRFPSATR